MAVQRTSLGSGRLAVVTVTVRDESAGHVSLSLLVDGLALADVVSLPGELD